MANRLRKTFIMHVIATMIITTNRRRDEVVQGEVQGKMMMRPMTTLYKMPWNWMNELCVAKRGRLLPIELNVPFRLRLSLFHHIFRSFSLSSLLYFSYKLMNPFALWVIVTVNRVSLLSCVIALIQNSATVSPSTFPAAI